MQRKAANDVMVTFPTPEAIQAFVGKIKGYDIEPADGTMYYQQDGEPYYIDGLAVLDQWLDRIPGVVPMETYPDTTKVMVKVKSLWDFLVSSGYRSMDYTEEDAVADITEEPIGILKAIAREYGVRVDPFKFIEEDTYAMREPDLEQEEYTEFHRGSTLRVAQKQHLLQQYETESGKILKQLKGIGDLFNQAHKSVLGEQFDNATKILQNINQNAEAIKTTVENATKELLDVNNTLVGVVGMEAGQKN